MTQLVGIARDVDGGDGAVATLKGNRINRTVFAAQHEAGQTVDSRVAYLNGGKTRVLARNAVEEAQDFLAAEDRVECRDAFTAAVGIEHHVPRKNLHQGVDVT